jgi:hypothetical protein
MSPLTATPTALATADPPAADTQGHCFSVRMLPSLTVPHRTVMTDLGPSARELLRHVTRQITV